MKNCSEMITSCSIRRVGHSTIIIEEPTSSPSQYKFEDRRVRTVRSTIKGTCKELARNLPKQVLGRPARGMLHDVIILVPF